MGSTDSTRTRRLRSTMLTTTNTGLRHPSDPAIRDFIFIVRAAPTAPRLSHASQQANFPSTQTEASPLSTHGIFYFLSWNMGRFPELTPVHSQTIEPWFATLEAGDITLLLEWASTSTRGLKRREASRLRLESRNGRQGTRSPQAAGQEVPSPEGVCRRRGWCVGNPRFGS